MASGKDSHVWFVEYTVSEHFGRVEDWREIADRAEKIYEKISDKNAFFELVLYPVKGAYQLNAYQLLAKGTFIKASKGELDNSLADKTLEAYNGLNLLTEKYHKEILNGKWDKFFNWIPYHWYYEKGMPAPVCDSKNTIASEATKQQTIPVSQAVSENGAIIDSDTEGYTDLWIRARTPVQNFSKAKADNEFCTVEFGDTSFTASATPINNVWHSPYIGPMWSKVGRVHINQGHNPLTGGTAWIQSENEAYDKAVEDDKATSLINPRTTVKEMLEGGSIHDKAIDWLNRVASFMGDLKDKNGNAIPVIFRPWHENTGSWFWWGDPNCTADEYKALWNMTQDYLNDKLPGQLLWAYSPSPKNMEHFLERWPGDDRVQILGSDCYHSSTAEDFQKKLGFWLGFMNDYAKDRNILIAITECGRKNSDIPDWWTQVLDPVATQFPICYCLPWRNYCKEHFGASKDATTAEDFKKFHELPQTLFVKDIKE